MHSIVATVTHLNFVLFYLYIDMEKFPLRMKDNELLVNDLYEDPDHEPVTSLSVYLTPNYCNHHPKRIAEIRDMIFFRFKRKLD